MPRLKLSISRALEGCPPESAEGTTALPQAGAQRQRSDKITRSQARYYVAPTRDRWEPSVIATSRLIARMKVMNRHTLLALLLIAALATAYPSRNPSHIPTTSVRNRSVISL
jgi:hypothetical protein